MNQKLNRDVEFLFEIGCFRRINRAWIQFMNSDFSNNAEHTFRVIWISLLIAKREGKGNTEKLIKMALVHDIPESRCGDLHYVSREYTKRNEVKALDDIFSGVSFGQEFKALWHEYHERTTIEAQIVKDADNLDVDFELREQSVRGHKYESIWKNKREKVMKKVLYTKTAKKIWEDIYNINPHSWHINAKNRFSQNDWKSD